MNEESYPPGAACCLSCHEGLRWWGDGYGHARGWCKGEPDFTVTEPPPDLRSELRWIDNFAVPAAGERDP